MEKKVKKENKRTISGVTAAINKAKGNSGKTHVITHTILQRFAYGNFSADPREKLELLMEFPTRGTNSLAEHAASIDATRRELCTLGAGGLRADGVGWNYPQIRLVVQALRGIPPKKIAKVDRSRRLTSVLQSRRYMIY